MDWLIHGESFFSKKYVIMKFVHPKDGYDRGSGEFAHEVRKEEHMKKLVDALDKIEKFSENIGWAYFEGYRVIDCGLYLREFDDCVVMRSCGR